MKDLLKIINELIQYKKEGSYWDFKQKWHDNNADLIRDILSLANGIEHQGDRYLIIGISDPPDCSFVGSEHMGKRKKQSDLLDLFSKLQFAGGFVPDLRIETCRISEKEIDVIIIKDLPLKPYYLMERYKNGELCEGAIYTRVGDKNTAKNSTADIYRVEKMWRERFGLDKTPFERVQQYLMYPKDWQTDGISKSYHDQFPEFTLEYDTESEFVSGKWWSVFLDEQTKKSNIIVRYHSTILCEQIICCFHRENITISHPDIDYVKINANKFKDAENTFCLFSFTKGTICFSMLLYLFRKDIDSLISYKSIRSIDKPAIKHLPFMIFQDEDEKKEFLEYLEQNLTQFFEEKNPYSEVGKEKEEELFAYWAYDKFFSDWKQFK
ncbi:MAG TPA: ATP-binding protein [bacterium]|nr:ATP-binding protein [bacterium]HPS29286.1 ATP-binding protein [bacterium]